MGLQHSHDLELYVCSERHVPAHVFNFTYLVWQPTTLTATVVVNSLHTSLCLPKYLTAFSRWQAAETRCTAIRTWNVLSSCFCENKIRQIFRPVLAVTRALIVRRLNTAWRRLASVYLILDGDISYRKSSINPPPPVPLIRPPPPFQGKKVNKLPPSLLSPLPSPLIIILH